MPTAGEATGSVEPGPVTPSSLAAKPSTTTRNTSWITAPPGRPRRASTSSWPSVLRLTTIVHFFSGTIAVKSSWMPVRVSVHRGWNPRGLASMPK